MPTVETSSADMAKKEGKAPEGANARRLRDIAEVALVVILVGALIAAAIACIVAVTVFWMSPLLLIAGVLLSLLAFVVVLTQVYVSLQSKSPLEVEDPLRSPFALCAILDPQLDPNQGVWILENGILKHDGKEVPADLYTLKYGDPEPSERALAFEVKGENAGILNFFLKELLQCDSSRYELKFESGSEGHHLCYVTIKCGAILMRDYLSAMVCEAMMGRPDALRAYIKMQMRDCGSEIEEANDRDSFSVRLCCFLLDCSDVKFCGSVLSHLHLNEEEKDFFCKAIQLVETGKAYDGIESLSDESVQEYVEKFWSSYYAENEGIEEAGSPSVFFADGQRKCGALLVPSETRGPDLVLGCTMPNFAAIGRYCAKAKEDRPSPSPTIRADVTEEEEGDLLGGVVSAAVAT